MSTGQVALEHNKPPAKSIAAAVAGNALEFYDFIIYSFFAVYIGKSFFPSGDGYVSLLSALAVFGVGFFTRPLGGVLIGAYADKKGRRAAMMLTVALITLGTLGLAATPSYEKIGIAAPIIVVIARMIQGLALGGEVGPASAMLIESAPPNKRAFYASWQMASQGVAVMVAGLVGYVVSSNLTQEQLGTWGWRIPFLVSLALIPIALYIRRALPETLEEPTYHNDTEMLTIIFTRYRKEVILGIMVLMATAITAQVGNYMTTFAINTLKFNPKIAQVCTISGGLMMFLFSLLAGILADKYGRKSIMLWPRVALMLLIVPMFYLLVKTESVVILLLVTMMITLLTGMSGASSLVAIPEMMPIALRATGVSVVYAIGVTLFGGTAQFVFAWLINNFGVLSMAYYVAGTSILSIIAILMMPETRHVNVKD
ncbi:MULTISPECIES: MFS transporter [Snodgrassella]|jgi:MFS family permease|uniref:MFS transporter n=1 Tax=Snodgrassella alvi TaxID=1196083 RepID=A0A855FMK3_9NEIS|nr:MULTISPECIES: MFS transporter [Snodgrassella]PIT14437.1 MFS transporter [Snodgrassella alvi]PIT19722.1 MFS transporter [Snodgrassella communis]PIT24493.1 MFS transporter [Snodgrassella alvi]PIT56379.1 MFS transporter [Snodgrassella alvi]PIT59346.1 MFS transporter [Snodgrassella alvi]